MQKNINKERSTVLIGRANRVFKIIFNVSTHYIYIEIKA